MNDEIPGLTRKRWGKGFIYFNEKHEKIRDSNALKRLKKLVIPPIWENVWISPLENSHLQSTGIDLKKRKQYLYHPDWINYRQKMKFHKMVEFGKSLSKIRIAYQDFLKESEWTKKKVIALVIYLLDNYYFRIGNIQYTQENESYGITTLRRKHLQEEAGKLVLNYKAKSGKVRNVKIHHSKARKLIREMAELPGYEIFRYKGDDHKFHKLDSQDINEFLQVIGGREFSAKDFRTWGASKLALELYNHAVEEISQNPRLKFETTLVRNVAKKMGNTISVCRTYYIHPAVLNYVQIQFPQPLLLSKEINLPHMDIFEILLMKIIAVSNPN
ncbi:MAG: DNA topoisomerase IB [Flammeovirgaceae bacterium]|nr:DNA topoisomerase IB [Flammeovirgaceae bacterium]